MDFYRDLLSGKVAGSLGMRAENWSQVPLPRQPGGRANLVSFGWSYDSQYRYRFTVQSSAAGGTITATQGDSTASAPLDGNGEAVLLLGPGTWRVCATTGGAPSKFMARTDCQSITPFEPDAGSTSPPVATTPGPTSPGTPGVSLNDGAPSPRQPAPPPSVDHTSPSARLTVRRSSRLGRSIAAQIGCSSEPCTARTSGTVLVPKHGRAKARTFRARTVITRIARGSTARITVKLSKSATAAIRRSLRQRGRKSTTLKLTRILQ